MLGAIIGDIVGSVYEWNNIKTKDFPLFRDDCFTLYPIERTAAVFKNLRNGQSGFQKPYATDRAVLEPL